MMFAPGGPGSSGNEELSPKLSAKNPGINGDRIEISDPIWEEIAMSSSHWVKQLDLLPNKKVFSFARTYILAILRHKNENAGMLKVEPVVVIIHT